MLTEEEVRSLLACRVQVCSKSCNRGTINHIDGQIRALLAVLNGVPPPGVEDGSTAEVFLAAGIPFTDDGERVLVDPAWLAAHGFDLYVDNLHHPRFSISW